MVAAAVGGTTSAIGGGKFANGAVPGAMVNMFNDQQSSSSGGDDEEEIEARSPSKTQPIATAEDAATVFEYFYPHRRPPLLPSQIDSEGVTLANTMTVAAAQAQGIVDVMAYFTPNPAAGPTRIRDFVKSIFSKNVVYGEGGLHRQDFVRKQLSALGLGTRNVTMSAYQSEYLYLRCGTLSEGC